MGPGDVISLVLSIFYLLALAQLFEKANQSYWAALVPIYNTYILTKIVGKPVWWVVLLLIPGINCIFYVWLNNLIAKGFGKGIWYTVGLVVLPYVFLPILAFSDKEFNAADVQASTGGSSQRFDH